jgi:hypothetical protein
MDQRIRYSRSHLPPLQQIRELDFTLAHVPPDLRNLSARQHLPRFRTIHST